MSVEEFDLVIVGAGSGNSIPDHRFAGWSMAIVEKADFGGTCMNRGCIPSKMFVYTAEVAETVKHAGRYGVHASFDHAEWPAVRDRVFDRIDPIGPAGERWRSEQPDTTVIKGEARFVDGTTLEVDGRRFRGRHTVLAAGSRPFVPPYPGIDQVDYCTSDTIMRLERLPEHLVILGGGVIASEMGHVFDGLGCRVTIVTRGRGLLSGEDAEVSEAFTAVSSRRFEIVTGARDVEFEAAAGGFVLRCVDGSGAAVEVRADTLLVATGRVPNSDLLDVDVAGIDIDEVGRVVVNRRLETNVPGVWAFGDLSSHFPLKHLANAEARVVADNIINPDEPREIDYGGHPRATFGAPRWRRWARRSRSWPPKGSPTSSGAVSTATLRTGGRSRTPRASPRSWPRRRPASSSVPTSWDRTPRPSSSR